MVRYIDWFLFDYMHVVTTTAVFQDDDDEGESHFQLDLFLKQEPHTVALFFSDLKYRLYGLVD